MAHERLFSVPDPSAGIQKRVNALHVTSIQVDARTTPIIVTLQSGADSATANFDTETDAQTFADLWAGRVEDAR